MNEYEWTKKHETEALEITRKLMEHPIAKPFISFNNEELRQKLLGVGQRNFLGIGIIYQKIICQNYKNIKEWLGDFYYFFNIQGKVIKSNSKDYGACIDYLEKLFKKDEWKFVYNHKAWLDTYAEQTFKLLYQLDNYKKDAADSLLNLLFSFTAIKTSLIPYTRPINPGVMKQRPSQTRTVSSNTKYTPIENFFYQHDQKEIDWIMDQLPRLQSENDRKIIATILIEDGSLSLNRETAITFDTISEPAFRRIKEYIERRIYLAKTRRK